METIPELCRRNDGIVTTQQLAAAGYASRYLTALVQSGTLIRVRNGWYASPLAQPEIVRAIRVGGRLAGISAAGWYGLATPERYPLHVQLRPNGARLRSPLDRRTPLGEVSNANVVTHWGTVSPPTESTRLVVSLHDCLRQVVLDEHEDDAVACIDSALRKGHIDIIDLELLRASLPARSRRIVDATDGRSDGYPESIIRRRLARVGIATQIQVRVLDERSIDLLIGDRLALEIDGRGKYLSDRDPEKIVRRFEQEKKRDAFLAALGFIVVHITYDMLLNDWDATLSMILAIMERGDHLHRLKIRERMSRPGVSVATRRIPAPVA